MQNASAGRRPLISIIIPVWHESNLATQLAALWDDVPFVIEIIVVDGDPSGDTLALLEPRADLQTLISPSKGRGFQLRAGAEKAQSEILLFLHADTTLPAGGLQLISDYLAQRPELAGGAFDLGINSSRMIFRILEKTSSWRSRLTRLPYGDQALFLRRSAYQAIGGFPAVPIMEDVGICQALKSRKLKIGFISHKVLTSARRWETEGLFRCTLRNWGLISAYFLGVSPDTLAKWYR